MKKYIISIIVIACALCMTSCKDFLQPIQEGRYTEETYFKSDQQAIDAVDMLYARFLEEAWLGREIMWEEAVANDMVWGRTRGWPELATMSLTTSVDPLNGIWENAYNTIARSNWVIEALLKKRAANGLTEIESRSLGEAYFCRALAHYYIAYRYGTNEQGVPFCRYEDYEEGYNNEVPPQQATVFDNYKMIIEDFNSAEELLPRCEAYDDSQFGRAHKAACEGFKAKVYTYWATWDKSQYPNVIECVNKMENELGRSINGVAFHDNFTCDYSKWRNSEYVWAIPSEGGPKGVYGGVEFPGITLDNSLWGWFNCWGQFKPTYDIYEEMHKDDAFLVDESLGNIRVKNSFAEYGEVVKIWGETDFRFYSNRDVLSGFLLTKYVEPFTHGEGKYVDSDGNELKGDAIKTNNRKWVCDEGKDPVSLGYVGDNGNWPVVRMNFPILRFADCMLLRAEAYLATGNAAGATKDINAIRARSNVKPLAGNATWTDLYHERRVELAFEYSGHAFDCKRWAVGGDPEIKNLALGELNTHPRVRLYTDPSNPGKYVDGEFVVNTDFVVGPYQDYLLPEPVWEDYKIVFPYNASELLKANGMLKQNKGYADVGV